MIADSSFRARENRYASLRAAKGIEKNLVARKCIEKIVYGIDQIKISLWLKDDLALAPDSKNFAPSRSIGNLNGADPVFAQNEKKPSEFGKFPFIPRSQQGRTIVPTLPNVIHRSKLVDLPARRVEAQK